MKAVSQYISVEWKSPPLLKWKHKPRECIIKGVIKGADGIPADGAEIILMGETEKKVRSDGTGFYAFTGLRPGKYVVKADIRGEDVTKEVKDIKVRNGEIKDISIEF